MSVRQHRIGRKGEKVGCIQGGKTVHDVDVGAYMRVKRMASP